MELPAKQFYIHQRFINIYYYIYMALEDWITKNIFREDKSRVFLASDEYAFRRRFELTDASESFSEIDISHLRFPFANYWPLNSGWKPDTRPAATTAAMVYDGIYEGTTRIRAIPSILSMPTTFYFDREDDARLAYDILYFKSFNEHYYEQEMPFGDTTTVIPISMEIKDIQFNPSFKENDWLKQNRIFVVKANMELRSFAIQPPAQPKLELDLTSDGYLSDGTLYDDGVERYYLTDEVILKFAPDYLKKDILLSNITVNGQLEESNIFFDVFRAKQIDASAATLNWTYAKGSQENVKKITISLDNNFVTQTISPSSTSYTFEDLQEGSVYKGCMTFFNKQGVPKRMGFTIYMEDLSQEKEAPKNSLIGFSW